MPMTHFLRTCFLDVADALRLDIDLVNDGDVPQYPPGGAVVFCFFQENLFTRPDHGIVLFNRLLHECGFWEVFLMNSRNS